MQNYVVRNYRRVTSTESPGLRERKRAETRQQLERAAVTLALEVGMPVTVLVKSTEVMLGVE